MTRGIVRLVALVCVLAATTACGSGASSPTPVAPLFTMNGSGDNVFDMPTSVSRVKITGDYSGYSSNFIVNIAGHLVVNELLGTGWSSTHFEGTYATAGGQVQITNSNGVRWSFTEVR